MSTPRSTENRCDPSPRAPEIRWIGGVVRVPGLSHAGKPMRVAAWITRAGQVLGAAIVEGHGPSLLREMLAELLARTDAQHRPSKVVVWPSVRAAFRDMEFPPVTVDKEMFLSVVIGDHADVGFRALPLTVRSAEA